MLISFDKVETVVAIANVAVLAITIKLASLVNILIEALFPINIFNFNNFSNLHLS